MWWISQKNTIPSTVIHFAMLCVPISQCALVMTPRKYWVLPAMTELELVILPLIKRTAVIPVRRNDDYEYNELITNKSPYSHNWI